MKDMSNSKKKKKECANPKVQKKPAISKMWYNKVLKHPTKLSTND